MSTFVLPGHRKKIALWVILSYLTAGLFCIAWMSALVRDVRALKRDRRSCIIELMCLFIVPFYSFYWWYTRGKAVREESERSGRKTTLGGVGYLLLAIFRLSIVGMAIMQHDLDRFEREKDEKKNKTVMTARGTASRDVLREKLCGDVASMGYTVTASDTEDGFTLRAEKDKTVADFFLGRRQDLLFTVRLIPSQSDTTAEISCESNALIDKVFSFAFGVFVFLIPWIFTFIALSNGADTKKVAERSVRNYFDKLNNENGAD